MTSQKLVNVSLRELCRQQDQPYIQLAEGDAKKERPLHAINQTSTMPFQSTAMYCGRVKEVIIFGKSYVTDQPGRAVFIGQSHRDYETNEFIQYYTSEIASEVRPRLTIEPECCFLGGAAPFGHYLFEYLSRLSAFEKVGVLNHLPVVVYDDFPEGWLGFIELCGVPRERIIRIPRHPSPHFKAVWVAGCPHALGADKHYTFWDDGVHSLRKRIGESVTRAQAENKGAPRIYLGRRGVVHRQLLNEDAVWNVLAQRGFAWPELSGMSAAEQVCAIASAEIIVSVVGSGSPMTMFAPDTCSIIEIRPKSIVGALGSMGFASVLGQTFTTLIAEVDPTDQKNAGIDKNLIMDLELLTAYVDTAIRQQELAASVARHSAAQAAKK
jgi:capsular polysaccharide biosynthesis protein